MGEVSLHIQAQEADLRVMSIIITMGQEVDQGLYGAELLSH